MCGRASQEEIDTYYSRVYGWEMPPGSTPHRNIRPTEETNIVVHRTGGEVVTVKANWWCQWDNAKTFETKFPAFNVRVETMDQKKLWSPLLKRAQRCIFPIDAFYEWPTKGKGVPPVKMMIRDRNSFAIAGLWSNWFDGDEPKYSFATFTVPPNDFMLPIHPQAMPVILDSIESQKLWLEDGSRELLVPYNGDMVADEMPNTLEQLFPDENLPPRSKQLKDAEPRASSMSTQGSLFD